MFPFDRWLVRVYGLLAATCALWLILRLSSFAPAVRLSDYLLANYTGWLYALLAVLFILSIRYLAFRLQPRKPHAFIRELEGGQIRIGHHTVREIATRAAKQIKGVKLIQVKIDESEKGLIVNANVQAEPVDLNAMSEAIQREINRAVTEMTSLAIAAVNVHVFELASDNAQK